MQRIAIPILVFFHIILQAWTLKSQTLNPKIAAIVEHLIDSIEPPIPNVKPLFPYHLRDVAISRGAGESYYLTGTTDDNWGVAEGIRVWESKDLENWEMLGENGFVWTFARDASNDAQREIKMKEGRLIRGIWAPEVHFINNNYWITYSVSGGYGSGLLRSKTGSPEGPYEDIKKDGPLVPGIDATLFKDVDGTVWYIWGPGNMKKLKADLSGFADKNPPVFPKDANGKEVGYEGVNMYYRDGIYYLMAAEWNCEGPLKGHLYGNSDVNRRSADGRYDCMVAMSKSITGPYSPAYIALSHGGHNIIFDDKDGNIWSTMFGNDEAAGPFRERPALVRMKMDSEKRIVPVMPLPFIATNNMHTLFVSPEGNNTKGESWKTAFHSIQKAIDVASGQTQIWISKGIYNEKLNISDKRGLYIYGGFSGNEKTLNDRDPEKLASVIDGRSQFDRILSIQTSEYIRIDGLQIKGGRNMAPGDQGNGAGICIEGGGETVRFANCVVAENYALKNGAGIYVTKGASPLFINCLISNNESNNNGGAIAVDCNSANGYHTRFYNCRITGNKARENGGVAWFTTDQKQTGTLRFINCLIDHNFTLLEGGNIVMNGGSTLLMSHCTVADNSGMSKGAAVATLGRVPAQNRIINSVFYGNYGVSLFVADAYEGVDPTSDRKQQWTQVENCLFSNNKTLGLFSLSYHNSRFESIDQINSTSWASDNVESSSVFDGQQNSYLLGKNSPAIGSGTLKNSFPVDMNGRRRFTSFDFSKVTVDPGCFQLQKNE
jgi:parallel beta-helix repeat protein